MIRTLLVILCFVLVTYSWAKYAASLEPFDLPMVEPNKDWFWPEPNEAHKGLPLAFVGGSTGSPEYATYMARFSDDYGYSDYEDNFSFKVTFSTLMSKGVLYVDQLEGQGLLFVSLNEGSLRFTLIHNQVPQVTTISGPLNDLGTHTLKVQRVPNESKIRVQVDQQPETAHSISIPDLLRGGINVYLGGIPISLKNYNQVYNEPSFIGCIYGGEALNKGQLEPFSLYNFTTTEQVKPTCEHPTFLRMYHGYATVPFPGAPKGNFNFSFSFKTEATDGLLFMDLSSRFMYVAVYLKEGNLWIAINDGSLKVVKVDERPLNDNTWHQVSVQEAGAVNLVWVYVDGQRQGVTFKNRLPFVNGSEVVVGGLPDQKPYNQVVTEERSLYAPLSADIRSVSVNGQVVDLGSFKVR